MDMDVDDDPDPADVAFLEARVAETTDRATGYSDERQLAIFQHDPCGLDRGGDSTAGPGGGCCELGHLWVDESVRSQRIGSSLMERAEAEARRRGCRQVVLMAHAVNSGPDGSRWSRWGYQLVARVDDYPVGDAALWYRKALDTESAERPDQRSVDPS